MNKSHVLSVDNNESRINSIFYDDTLINEKNSLSKAAYIFIIDVTAEDSVFKDV
jgi:hypothetical protein